MRWSRIWGEGVWKPALIFCRCHVFNGSCPLFSPVLAEWFYKLISQRQLQALYEEINSDFSFWTHRLILLVTWIDYLLLSFVSARVSFITWKHICNPKCVLTVMIWGVSSMKWLFYRTHLDIKGSSWSFPVKFPLEPHGFKLMGRNLVEA